MLNTLFGPGNNGGSGGSTASVGGGFKLSSSSGYPTMLNVRFLDNCLRFIVEV
jgi:hypothetical protein